MIAPAAKLRVKPAATIAIRPEFGWRRVDAGRVALWVKGYGRVQNTEVLVKALSGFRPVPDSAELSKILLGLDGHFALGAAGPGWACAAVDRVRSIPLAFAEGPEGWIIDDQAERLRARLRLEEVDPDAALALAMAGYTVDVATLFKRLHQLGPGELALFLPATAPARHRYYTYRPWRADKPAYDATTARKALAEIILAVIDDMMRGIGDRPLAVPLSAGRDSRLIVSAARHLGYRNICTFAYGRPGNHEARTSRAIAGRLGYPWRFVSMNTAFMRRYYASAAWDAYCRFADSLQATPFVQDLPQIQVLKQDGYIPEDAVLCNGNSGDYISGNHIVSPMDTVPTGLTVKQRLARITGTLYRKHFALWRVLQTDGNRARIEMQLRDSIAHAGGALDNPTDDYGVYEYAEFQNRQCKYVITGQRIYEFLGHEWRLPLWDRRLLDFFEAVPLEGKAGQRLYAEALEAENWGGVWQGLPVNRKTIRPHWVRPLRAVTKVLHAPLGPDAWHRFERRYFQYWMENVSHSAIRAYAQVARDRRGARHGIAWLTLDYLERHRLGYDGSPLRAG